MFYDVDSQSNFIRSLLKKQKWNKSLNHLKHDARLEKMFKLRH